jgi:ABC-type spermidine/putrescine transport system permease subunit II
MNRLATILAGALLLALLLAPQVLIVVSSFNTGGLE